MTLDNKNIEINGRMGAITERGVFKDEKIRPNEYFDLLVTFQSHNENFEGEELFGIEEIEMALQSREITCYIKESECLNGVLVELNMDPVTAAMKIMDSPTRFLHKIIIINKVVRTRMDYILEKVVELAMNKMAEDDTFAVRCDLMGRRLIKSEEELFNMVTQELIEKLNFKCDEINPDWVVQIEVIGENTGISVLKPTELFKKSLNNLEGFKEDIYGSEESINDLDNINLNSKLLSVFFILMLSFFTLSM
ncbi:MAG: THUMP domain-containing protein [Methanobacterium paludis]|uniref:THUMP domain-containing protein n=1 Tax=Methanobacterium paludis (strain DSM 25820 / JCM 18151 / SWAN1) TaxID=868131 RepID=F6D2L1_METPW|nr:THUMP domain-containing protein [Methanobacterium paludis]AEG17945.1 THUMP domain-containing protein [Methanobacterium paludis]MCE7698478.1 THUMP domain-containing protein [Methanobacterium paludis]